MQTTIRQVSPVEYELEITATADDLAPEFTKALREQRARTQLKGFRPGKVPLSLVKKMYGKVLAFSIADKSVQEIYEEQVLKADEYDVLGQPRITKLDYEMDGDLHAVVQFGVRPEIDIKEDLSEEQVTKLVHRVTDEDVEGEIERLQHEHADLVPVEDEDAGEEDLVVFDLQEVDAATGTPIVGKRDEDRSLFLNDPRIDNSPFLSSLRDALKGARVGASVRFHFEHDQAHGEHVEGHAHAHHFMAVVKEIKRRELPDIDEEFAREVSGGEIEDVDTLREEIRKQLERSWERRSREYLEGQLMKRMLELHPVPVPESVIEVYLDSFVEDVKRRNEGKLPPNFDEQGFREANREEAEEQARWMLIRDRIIEKEGLEVTNEDLERFFEQEAAGNDELTPEQLRQFYQAVPQLMEQVEQRLLSRKVFDLLAGRFNVVEKDRETLEKELEERRAQREAELAEANAPAEPEAGSESAVEDEE